MSSGHPVKTLFANIGQLLTSTLEVDEILERIMREVREYFEPRNWSLLRLDPNTCELFFVIADGLDPEAVRDLRIRPGEGIAGTVAASGEPIFVPDASRDPRFSARIDGLTGFRTRSLIAVPLVFRDRVFGVIELINRLEDRPFTDDDLLVLQTIAEFAAIAFANAQLYEEARQLASRDPLTGLWNRHHLDLLLEDWTGQAGRRRREQDRREKELHERVVAVMIDLDNFKEINDTLGHHVGDRVLKAIAQAMRECLRSHDLLFRIGGDEFLALAPVFSDQAEEAIRARLKASCAGCLARADDLPTPVEYSFGMAAGAISETREVIHQADLAMYEAKKSRKLSRSG